MASEVAAKRMHLDLVMRGRSCKGVPEQATSGSIEQAITTQLALVDHVAQKASDLWRTSTITVGEIRVSYVGKA